MRLIAADPGLAQRSIASGELSHADDSRPTGWLSHPAQIELKGPQLRLTASWLIPLRNIPPVAIFVSNLSAFASSSSVWSSNSFASPMSQLVGQRPRRSVGSDLVMLDSLGRRDQSCILGDGIALRRDDLLAFLEQALHPFAGLHWHRGAKRRG